MSFRNLHIFYFFIFILQGGFLNLIALYFLLLFVLKRVFYEFKITNVHCLKLNTLFSLTVWSLVFGVLSSPYFFLDGVLRIIYLNFYFVFMSLVGLNGFTILIFDLNLKDSLLKTFKKMKPAVFNRNFAISLFGLNLLLLIPFTFRLIYLFPFLLFIVTRKYLNLFEFLKG